MKANVVVIVSGGIVQDVVADLPVNVTVIDCDIEEGDLVEIEEYAGDSVHVIKQAIEINPEFVKQFAEVQP